MKSLILKLVLLAVIMVIILGIFNFFGKSKESTQIFLSEGQYKESIAKQSTTTLKLIDSLREYGVKEDASLKLEYFFYTNSIEKAVNLAKELEAMKYDVQYGELEDELGVFLVTGWSERVLMEKDSILNWDREMFKLGYKHDARFDGWGTNVE
tara:strand:+ start:113157 stop:113615 length:459 start_codon:yes stop_codon:yes gene_type:complete